MQSPNGWGPYEGLSKVIQQAQAATVRITASTAVMISDRFAITAAHSPLDGNNQITPDLKVQNLWGETRKIINVFYDVEKDFAIVELETPFENAYAVKLATAEIQPGEQTFIVGHPWTVAASGIGWAVAFGTKSDLVPRDPASSIYDVDVQGGFSGSGLFNAAGELIGVLSGSFTDSSIVSPYFNPDLPVQNDYWDVHNGWLAGAVSLNFIRDFLSQYGVDNRPQLALELPENRPDPANPMVLSPSELEVVEAHAKVDRLSSVLVTQAGAANPGSWLWGQGGSGTLIDNDLVLTVLHALDARREASVGFFDRQSDPAALTYALARYGDIGLLRLRNGAPDSVPVQQVAAHNVESGDGAYLIGSPRSFWLSEGGWWVVGARVEGDGVYQTVAGNPGGMSGGAVYDLDSNIVGVISSVWGDNRTVPFTLTDRQDPHTTDYNPTLNQSIVRVASPEFFFLKQFVSEYSPAAIDPRSNDYFVADAAVIGDRVIEVGWRTAGGENAAYIKRYTPSGEPDLAFGPGGLMTLALEGVNETVKAVLPHGDHVYLVGNQGSSGRQNIFVARLNPDGSLDGSFGDQGISLVSSPDDEFVAAAAMDAAGRLYIAATRVSSVSADVVVLRLLDGVTDDSFGVMGYAGVRRDTSSDFAADIGLDDHGKVYVLSTTDQNRDWDLELVSFDADGQLRQDFGQAGSVLGDYERSHETAARLLVLDTGVIFGGTTTFSIDESPLLFKVDHAGQPVGSFGNNGRVFLNIDNGGSNFLVDLVPASGGGVDLLVAGTVLLQANEGWGDLIDLGRTSKIVPLTPDGQVQPASARALISGFETYPMALVDLGSGLGYLQNKSSASGIRSSLVVERQLGATDLAYGDLRVGGLLIDGIKGSQPSTIDGTPYDDIVVTGEGPDTIFGNAGDDFLWGWSGNDSIVGGAGNDRLDGGEGDDTVVGGGGFDHLKGSGGTNWLVMGSDGGEIEGYFGFDTVVVPGKLSDFFIWSATRSSVILMNKQNPTVMYSAWEVERFVLDDGVMSFEALLSREVVPEEARFSLSIHDFQDVFIAPPTGRQLTSFQLTAGVAPNYLFLGPGDDTVEGGLGNDRIYGVDGHDDLSGQGGDDLLHGGSGDDRLEGGPGDDQLDGGPGDDRMNGGEGADTITLSGGADQIDGGPGEADRLLLSGTVRDYQLFRDPGTGALTLINTAPNHKDSAEVIGVEMFVFQDVSLRRADVLAIANARPQSSDGWQSMDEDQVLETKLPEATDVDGESITFSRATDPSNGTVTVSAGGQYTYTPNANFNGTDSFTFTVSDGNGGSNTYTQTITITAVNDAPAASDAAATVAEDQVFTAAVPVASDVDSTAFTYALVAAPSNGTLNLKPDGSYTYTPKANFNGTDTFTYRANDGQANSNTATVSLTVTPVNDAPVVANPIADTTATEASPFSLKLASAAFSDTDGDALSLSATQSNGSPLPTWLTFDAKTLTFSGQPSAADIGTLGIRLTASDGTASVSDTFDLVIKPKATPVQGVVTDGYVAGAALFIDRNGNNRADPDEDTGLRTDAAGRFSGAVVGQGALIAVGGTNLDTGLPNNLALRAPLGASVISPLTTLVDTLADQMGTSPDQAKAQVVQALGLPAGTDLLSFDALAPTAGAAGLAVQQSNVQIALSLGLLGDDATVMSKLAQAISSAPGAAVVDLASPATLAALAAPDAAAGAVQMAAATNAAVDKATSLQAISTIQGNGLRPATPGLNRSGTANADTLVGGNEDDTLSGGEGTDRLSGGPGNDRLDGGPGRDEVRYSTKRADHQITRTEDGSLLLTGPEGNDTLINVERLIFQDQALAFDVDGMGGKTYRLYKAAYDRVPDAGGVGFWMHYLDNGFDMLEAANNFMNAEEFRTLYDNDPSTPGNQPPSIDTFVTKLYRHVLQRDPEGAGYQFWVDAMNNKDGAFGRAFTAGEVLLAFAESAENKAKVIGLIEQGFEYLPFVPPGG